MLTFLFIYSPSDVLVLKNGKTVTCRSYKVANGQVTIKTRKETFVLPEKLVDWERSKAEKARRDQAALARKKEAEEAKRLAEAEAAKEVAARKPVVLTDDDYEQKVGPRKSGKVTIAYQTMGNSILVKAKINGQGPYDILLDTGASITLISPELAQQLNLSKGETKKLIGVGGQAVLAQTAVLERVALGGAEVKGLKVTIRAIDQLNSKNVVGLLGQDFLNHFTMELDPAAQTVALSPSGMGGVRNREVESLEAFLKKPDKAFQTLRAVTQELGVYYNRYQSMSPGRADTAHMRRVRELDNETPRISAEMDRTWGHLSQLPEDANDPETQANIRRLLACRSAMESYMRALTNFSSTLRNAYSNATSENRMAKYKADLLKKRSGVSDALKNYNQCVKGNP